MYVFCSVSDSLPSSRHATAWPQTSPKEIRLFLVLVISIFKLDIGNIPSGTLPFLLTRRSFPLLHARASGTRTNYIAKKCIFRENS